MSRHGNPGPDRAGYDGGDTVWDDPSPSTSLFDPHPDEDGHHDDHPSGPLPASRSSRRAVKLQQRRRRRRRVLLALSVVVLLGLGVGAWQLSGRMFSFGGGDEDYVGEGSGSVSITVATGDDATQIGSTLHDADVVKSVGAFVAAAKENTASLGIQPGVYGMRKQMSGVAALNLLLQPTTRLTKKLTIPEGSIEPDVLADLATTLGVPLDQVVAASKQIDQLGLPASYTTPTMPTSVEGFLFPATYEFDPGTTPLQALQEIVAQFTANDRRSGISSQAAALGVSPYQVLIIASIAQAEIKFDADGGKVSRVILNRIAIARPLQVDATSAYYAKLNGLDPSKVIYAEVPGPYNSYTNPGLPPTPIGSPGGTVLGEAAAPEAGDWIYYVNKDAAGNLLFTADENEFLAAAETCRVNGWGCG